MKNVVGIQIRIADVPTDALAEFGLKEKRGALVTTVAGSGPAAKGGVEPGDVIVEFNGKPIHRRDELVSMVVNTKPGSTVPVKVLRDKQEKTLHITIDELNLEEETPQTSRGGGGGGNDSEDEAQGAGFGLTLNALTSDMARRLRVPADTEGVLVTEVEPGSSGQRAGVSRGDVILQVNRKPVHSPREASRALSTVQSGSSAFLLILRNGQQTFVTVRKE